MITLQKNKLLIIFAILCFAFSNVAVFGEAKPAKNIVQKQPQPEINAISAILMDENGNLLYEKNAHQPLPPASVTKIMTLLLAVESVEQGKIKLEDKIVTSENAWRQGGSQIWLEPGENMTVKEMLTAIAVVSANDAAVAILEYIYGSEQLGIEAMNNRAKSLQLANTHFSNSNGLPEANHYMSAYDAAVIAKEALKHPLYMELCGIKEDWLRNGKNWLVNTNKLLWWYEGADGLKTGWTEEAKYCFVGTAKKGDLRLISAVFGAPEPRSHLRESMKLLDWGYANFSAQSIIKQGAIVEKLKVNKGVEKEIELIADQDLNLVIGKGENKSIQKKVVTPRSARAPIEAGKKYGELVIVKEGEETVKVDLVAGRDVPKAGFAKIFHGMLINLFSLPK